MKFVVALGPKTTSKLSRLPRFENRAFLNILNFENLAQTDRELCFLTCREPPDLRSRGPVGAARRSVSFQVTRRAALASCRVILFLAGVEYLSPFGTKTICKCWSGFRRYLWIYVLVWAEVRLSQALICED